MRFRLTHLLVVTAVVALLSYSLAVPTLKVNSWMRLVVWASYVALFIRAITTTGRERLILISALVAGLSYLYLSTTPNDWTWGVGQILLPIYKWYFEDGAMTFDTARFDKFRMHGNYAASYLFAFLGGCLAAYWTRQNEKRKEIGL